jgi:hypothetical protein
MVLAQGSDTNLAVGRRTSTGWLQPRLTSRIDTTGAALAIDSGNRSHVLIGPNAGGIYYYSDRTGSWAGTTLSGTLVSTGKVSLRTDLTDRQVAVFAAKSGTSYGLYYALGAAAVRSSVISAGTPDDGVSLRCGEES